MRSKRKQIARSLGAQKLGNVLVHFMEQSIFCIFTIVSLFSYWQQAGDKILYVVDSISVIDDPDPDEGALSETDIETLTVITDMAAITRHGYKDLDRICLYHPKRICPATKRQEKDPAGTNEAHWRKVAEIPRGGVG